MILRPFIVASLGLMALAASACSAHEPRVVPIDCEADDDYELESLNALTWYGFGDSSTHDGTAGIPQGEQAELVTLDEPRCESSQALFFHAYEHYDWGAGYAAALPMVPGFAADEGFWDASGYEGISFWARSLKDKAFQLSMGDRRTTAVLAETSLNDGKDDTCTPSEHDNPVRWHGILDVPNEDRCGNAFLRWVMPTEHWQFFAIPFKDFLQSPRPNVVEGGIDRATISPLAVAIPKDFTVELYIDQIAWYRKR